MDMWVPLQQLSNPYCRSSCVQVLVAREGFDSKFYFPAVDRVQPKCFERSSTCDQCQMIAHRCRSREIYYWDSYCIAVEAIVPMQTLVALPTKIKLWQNYVTLTRIFLQCLTVVNCPHPSGQYDSSLYWLPGAGNTGFRSPWRYSWVKRRKIF